MKALTWHGKGDIRCDQVADPTIQDDATSLQKVRNGDIDPSFHRAGPKAGPELYKTFRDKEDGCIKVVMRPHG